MHVPLTYICDCLLLPAAYLCCATHGLLTSLQPARYHDARRDIVTRRPAAVLLLLRAGSGVLLLLRTTPAIVRTSCSTRCAP